MDSRIKNIITNSIAVDVFCKDWENITSDQLRHLSSFIDYSQVPDRIIADNQKVQNIIDWDRIDKMKIIRLIARNRALIDKFNIFKYNYSVKELKYMLKIHPDLCNEFKIDFENLSKSEAFILLELGHSLFFRKIKIEKYKFDALQTFRIIQSYGFIREVNERLDLKPLQGYHVAEILIETGLRDLDLLDITKVSSYKWVEVLQSKPELLKYCDLEKFRKSDIFYSVQITIIFEELEYLILERDYYSELSAFGWEKLIITSPKWWNKCNFEKLNIKSLEKILIQHPNL